MPSQSKQTGAELGKRYYRKADMSDPSLGSSLLLFDTSVRYSLNEREYPVLSTPTLETKDLIWENQISVWSYMDYKAARLVLSANFYFYFWMYTMFSGWNVNLLKYFYTSVLCKSLIIVLSFSVWIFVLMGCNCAGNKLCEVSNVLCFKILAER